MLKRFFISFLGAVAGFWVSIVLCFLVGLGVAGALIAGAIAGGSDAKSVSKHSILYLNLEGEIVDRETSPRLFEELKSYGDDGGSIALNDIVDALDAAATDDNIDGLFIECRGAVCGLANAQAIVNAIDRFAKSKKWTIAYGDQYTQTNYLIASHCDSVLVNPIGSVDIHGLGTITPFFKGLVDKLGINVQVTKVGTYKSAVEPFTLTAMSEAAREQQEQYLNNMWSRIKEVIATGRGLQADSIDSLADRFMAMADASLLPSMGIVDGLRYRHEVDETLCRLTDTDDRDDLRLVTPSSYQRSRKDSPSGKGTMKVAVLYALGDINDSGDEGIVGRRMADVILDIADDEDVDALIMRVNSPGGSAFASEQIWEALDRYKSITGKPFYVSMSDYAASGGYYISCGADRIYAEALTLTGSIGVFGMIPDLSRCLSEKVGITTSTVETNPNATFPSIMKPMTEPQRLAMQQSVNRIYEQFVGRVAKGRKMSVDSVKTIAEGRVWDGSTALKLGLVDRLGGLDMAIEDMAAELGVSPDKLEIATYPDVDTPWWKDIFALSTMKMKTWLLADELDAETMMVYKAVSQVKKMNNVQARIPFMIVF